MFHERAISRIAKCRKRYTVKKDRYLKGLHGRKKQCKIERKGGKEGGKKEAREKEGSKTKEGGRDMLRENKN